MKQKADLILKNGAIYTMVCENSVVEALAVHNGKIVYTGTTEEVLAHEAVGLGVAYTEHRGLGGANAHGSADQGL